MSSFIKGENSENEVRFMKRTLKILTALTLALMVFMSMTGCVKIDKMREEQGYMYGSSIILNGETYKRLPLCDYLVIDFEGNGGSNLIYITDKEVPVLLSAIEGTSARLSNDKKFIRAYYDYTAGDYCHESIYDAICKEIEAGYNPDGYLYSCYDIIEEEYNVYEFTDKQRDALNEVLTTIPTLDEAPFNSEEVPERYSKEIRSFKKGMPFEKYEMTIIRNSLGFFIEAPQFSVVTEEYLYSDWYEVPANYHIVFTDMLMKAQQEADFFADEK